MEKKIDYPVQMASIKKGDWRLREYLDRDEKELEKIEHFLWEKITKMVKLAPKPKKPCEIDPSLDVIGYGWEWIACSSEESQIVYKHPRGIFEEVSDPEYLQNLSFVYDLCRKYYGDLVLETEFERKTVAGQRTNLIKQEKLESADAFCVDKNLTKPQKQQLFKFTNISLKLMEEWDWLPDVKPQKISGGLFKREKWQVWNMGVDTHGDLKMFDLVPYYDVFRLYPQRTKKEKIWKKERLLSFKNFLETL